MTTRPRQDPMSRVSGSSEYFGKILLMALVGRCTPLLTVS